jgi:TolB-like protein/Tfp pilus assembly protein PilF
MQPGTRLGPYEILAPVGAGGMGEVYRARDARLGRDVAIKVLPADLAADAERLKRFEREARATAALSHVNILAIHDVGTHEGVPYLVEELLEGESLRGRLTHGALPVAEAVEIATQVARGLAAAHGKHLVHRDLKPDNVFLTDDGTVKILDFGLAKLVEVAPGEADTLTHAPTGATEFGRVLGTAAYMSPEQARGMPVDERSDIFALGVVLYEMLTGTRPFRGETATDTIAAILKEEPKPLPESVPAAVQAVVTQCLAKRPDERLSSAHDLAVALRAHTTGEVPATAAARVAFNRRRVIALGVIAVAALAVVSLLLVKLRPAVPKAGAGAAKKIVVLPFENLGAPEDAYFASGMAEEITSRLANVQGLGVISRTTAAQYEHTRKTVKQIGADLGVDYVLEGSVRWEHGQGKESRVRITPQLIRVTDDTHVWADRYDRVMADVFGIQSEVAESAVNAMGVALLPRERTALKEISTNDLEAYDLFLRGMELFGRGESCEIFGPALEKFQAAVDRDPRFAQALAMTASTQLAMAWMTCDHGREHLAKGKEAAERAIELRPDLAETHVALGDYYYRGLRDCSRAVEEYARALKIQPSNGYAFLEMGMALRFQGRRVEAVEAFEKGLKVDPKNVHLLHHFGITAVELRRYAEVDRSLGLEIALSPQWPWPYDVRAYLQVQWHGDVAKAQAILDEASHVAGINESFLGTRRWLALLRRDYPEALRLLEAEEKQAIDHPGALVYLSLDRGQVHMLAGQSDLAHRSFETARLGLEKKMAQNPNEADHSSLGIAYAGLGRRGDAVREVKLGCDPLPTTKCGMPIMDCLHDLALVYTMVGQPNEAIAKLDELLSRDGDYSAHTLRLDPSWDPLRSDPRFHALLKKYEVKE